MNDPDNPYVDHDPAPRVYCEDCGEPCEVDDGRVTLTGPPAFPPSSACCGAALCDFWGMRIGETMRED